MTEDVASLIVYFMLYLCFVLRNYRVVYEYVSGNLVVKINNNDAAGDFTAGQILSDNFVNNATVNDCAYRIFEHDRGSPAYFAHKKKEFFHSLL